MKKVLLTLIALIEAISMNAQYIHVDEPGKLYSAYMSNKEDFLNMTELTLSGDLCGPDFSALREMAGRTYMCYDQKDYFIDTSGSLKVLDMYYSSIIKNDLDYYMIELDGFGIDKPRSYRIKTPNSIPEYVFSDCKQLSTIILPRSLASIESYAFSGCTGLSSVSIQSNVTSIGDYAFEKCINLATIYCYAKEVPEMGEGVFEGANPESISLFVPPASVEAYKAAAPWSSFGAIYGIRGLTYTLTYVVDGEVYSSYDVVEGQEITPEAAPSKVGYAFSGWSEIPETMPAEDVTITGSFIKVETDITKDNVAYEINGGHVSVTHAEDASGEVTIEASVVIGGETYDVTVIAEDAFNGCNALISVVIPSSITSIGARAFYGCAELRLIEIGDGVKEIGSNAFANIYQHNSGTRLKDEGFNIICKTDVVPGTSPDAFEGTDIANATLYVPDNLVETYKLVAPWNGFGTITGLSGTDIKAINNDGVGAVIYDIHGSRLSNVRKGLNILRANDGSVKKVIVK